MSDDQTITMAAAAELIRQARADEAKRMNHRWRTQVLDNERDRMRLDILADLRDKVEALHSQARDWGKDGHVILWVNRDQVLALLDRGGDD